MDKPANICNVFVYGTLMDKARLNSLLKRIPEMHQARATGYRQFYDDSLGYQSAERDERASIRGMILMDITGQELISLDHYEGIGEGSYRRMKTRVSVPETKQQVEAYIYVKND